jgi:hypothetical protein
MWRGNRRHRTSGEDRGEISSCQGLSSSRPARAAVGPERSRPRAALAAAVARAAVARAGPRPRQAALAEVGLAVVLVVGLAVVLVVGLAVVPEVGRVVVLVAVLVVGRAAIRRRGRADPTGRVRDPMRSPIRAVPTAPAVPGQAWVERIRLVLVARERIRPVLAAREVPDRDSGVRTVLVPVLGALVVAARVVPAMSVAARWTRSRSRTRLSRRWGRAVPGPAPLPQMRLVLLLAVPGGTRKARAAVGTVRRPGREAPEVRGVIRPVLGVPPTSACPNWPEGYRSPEGRPTRSSPTAGQAAPEARGAVRAEGRAVDPAEGLEVDPAVGGVDPAVQAADRVGPVGREAPEARSRSTN